MRRVIVLLLILLSIGLPSLPVAAQETCSIVNFEEDSREYTILDGNLEGVDVSGGAGHSLRTRYYEESHPIYGAVGNMIAIVEIPLNSIPNHVSMMAYTPGVFTGGYYIEACVFWEGGDSNCENSGELPPDTGWYERGLDIEDTYPLLSVSYMQISVFTGYADLPGPDGRFARIDNIAFSFAEDCEPEETGLTRPLQAQDKTLAYQSFATTIVPGGDVDVGNDSVIFMAQNEVMVSAVMSGVVTLIEPLNPDLCYTLFDPTLEPSLNDIYDAKNDCRVTVKSGPTQLGQFLNLFDEFNNPDPAFAIHIEGDDGREYIQIATHYQNYVFEGQTVSAGCYLGKTLRVAKGLDGGNTVQVFATLFSDYIGIIFNLLNIDLGDNTPVNYMTAVWSKEADSFVNVWDEYTLDPSDSAPCNSPEGYEGCLSDTRLEDASQWESSNGVSWLLPGALLNPNAYIRGVFNLNADREPAVLVGAYAMPLGILAITLGTESDLINHVLGMTTLDLPAGDPDAGDFYTLTVRNTGNVPVRLDFICVSHGRDPAGNPAQTPSEIPPDRTPGDINQTPATRICFFTDSSFENGLEEWEATGDVEEAPGALRLPDDATITQNLNLPAGSYVLTVITRVWALSSYTPDEEDDTGGITLSYAYPDASFTSMGEKTWGDFSHLTQTYRANITIEEDETEDFTLKAEMASAPSGVLGVTLNSACLSTSRLGQDPDQTGDGDGLIQPTCGTIEVPPISATQPGTWATWTWANLNKFYRCELMIVINNIYTAITQFFRTATWSIRWSQAAAVRTATWLNSVFMWFNGHLSNIALGQTTTIVSGGETCGNVFCLVQSLLDGAFSYLNNIIDVIQQLMDYLLDPDSPFWQIVADLISDSIDLIRDVINQSFGLLRDVLEFFMNLINSIVSFLLTLAEAIIALILLVVGQILNLAGLARDLLASIVSAWNNATPIQIPGLPDCSTYSHFWCKGVWVLDNTIYAKTTIFTIAGPMEIIQSIMIGMGSVSLILWVIKEFKTAIHEIGGAV